MNYNRNLQEGEKEEEKEEEKEIKKERVRERSMLLWKASSFRVKTMKDNY